MKIPAQTSRTYLYTIIDQYNPESDWSDYENLLKCIKKGDKRAVMDLLVNGCRVVRPGTLNTPLHLAVERIGWAFIVKQLLERGARVNFVNSNNDTALHHAFLCEAVDLSINSMVIHHLKETNDNLVNNDGVSYLHIVCARSKLTYVKEFFKGTNIDVNSQVSMTCKTAYAGFTALHFAVEFGKVDIAKYLLDNNASIYVPDANRSTPLHLACYRGNVEIIDMMLSNDQARVNAIDNLGTSHFIAACMSSKSEFVKQYLIVAYRRCNIPPMTLVTTKMCDFVVYPFPGYTPLHFAAQFGRLETVKMLLNYGAFCCAMATTGETAFSLAYKNSHMEICGVLKRHCQALMLANQVSPIAQSQGTVRLMTSSTTVTSIDSGNYQNYSSPGTTLYNSNLCTLEQCVTPIDRSRRQY